MTTDAGIFWLPDSPDKAIRGQLTFGARKAPRLELSDSLTPAWQVARTTTDESGNEVRELEPSDDTENFVVHGALQSAPHQVTLLGCITVSRRDVIALSGGFEDQTLSARYLIRGAHTSGEDQLFTKARIRVANIDSWANLPGFSINIRNAGRIELTYQRTQLPSATTESGATVRISEGLTRSWPKSTGGHITRLCWILVEDFAELTFNVISRDYITPLVSVLNFAIGVASPITGIDYWPKTNGVSSGTPT